MRTDRFESVDTNTHLYLECRTMARFARGLGREHEEREWDQRAETLARQINALLFDPATGTYQDRHIVDGRFSGMLTPSVFMPLYAGIAPRDVAQAMCRRYLLDPQRFYTTLPFATLDRSHPAFRSGGYLYAPPSHPGSLVQQAYWIGRAWPHVSYWMVGALWHSGLHAEADEAAARILDAISRSESIYECYDSLTGFGNGHPEMMWSGAAVLALAYRRYALPAVAEPA
jgi:glycogen debranching enzyme